MEIKDSGNRRKFESGAVRDIAEGKGREDLLPLDCVAEYFGVEGNPASNKEYKKADACGIVLNELNNVLRGTPNFTVIDSLNKAIYNFIRIAFDGKTGYAIMELAKHYEQGAVKYGERNYELGLPAHCFIDSCVRHLLKWYDGWDDEPHDRAVLWNLFGLMWTLKHKPEMNDLPWNEENKDGD